MVEQKKPYPTGSMIKWLEYGQETFDMARRSKKPVFLLVSAAWCHWCHVYESKSLEDKEIVDLINNEFIPIFVDADKRRDVAKRLLAGGWPTTVFFSQSGKKISSFSGHMPSEYLRDRLKKIREQDNSAVEKKKIDIMPEERVERAELSSEDHLKMLIETFERLTRETYDPIFGGFGDGMKFPHSETLDYLIDVFLEKKNRDLLAIVLNSLEWMIRGIHDDVEGGFFRYATRRDWSLPHYEKMLNDNAVLIRLLLKTYAATKKKNYKDTVCRTLEYVLNELYDPKNGCFYGSQDADEDYYKRGSLKERRELSKPYVDKTKYSDWNSVMISSMFFAYSVLNEKRYLEVAEKSLDFLNKNLIGEHGALHYYDERKQSGLLDGQLINNAFVISTFFDAYRTTNNRDYLKKGMVIVELVIRKFYDNKGFGFIERNSEAKEYYLQGEEIVREKIYGENAVMAHVLAQAYELTGKELYLKIAKETIGRFMYDGIVGLEESVNFAKAAKKILSLG